MSFLSLANCRCALARASALFLVIALCLICRRVSADIAVLPEPYFTNGVVSVEAWCRLHTITNSFVDYDSWEVYRNSILSTSQSLHSDAEYLSGQLQSLMSDLLFAEESFDDAFQTWLLSLLNEALIADPNGEHASLWDTISEAYDLIDYLYPSLDNIRYTIRDDLLPTTSYILQGVDSVTNQVRSLDAEFREAELVDYVEVGMEPYDGPAGGGCHCPDYRSYLVYLQGQLDVISSRVESIENELQRFLDGFATEALSEFGDSAYPAITFGSWLATLLGSLQAVYYRDYDHLNIVSTNVLAHILDGWVYPTNRVDDPLFVSVVNGNDDLINSLQNIFADLEVTVKQGTNVWNVAVTNQVLVSVTNEIENINNIDVEQTAEDLGSKLNELGEPEEIDASPEDYSTVFEDYKDAGIELGQKWKQLFTDAVQDTDDMPVQIKLFSGYQPSGAHFDSLVIVPTTYWTIDTFCASIFRSIRSVCRFLWMILEIAIIARLFKINIFLVYQGIIVLFAVAAALGCPGLQKISWGEALNNIATSFRNNVDMFFPAPEDA